MSNALSMEAVLVIIGIVLAASVAWLLYIISRRKRNSDPRDNDKG